VRFSGLQPLTGRSQLDVVLDGLGSVDLRNQARVVGVRFTAGAKEVSVLIDFELEESFAGKVVTLAFLDAEVFRLEPELPLAADPEHGHALLTELLLWRAQSSGRDGCTVATTLLTMDLYTSEVRATVR
jgi:hypothetical protein